MTTLTATFTFDSWDEQEVLDVEGARLVRTTFVKTFAGDLTGSSRGEMVMAHASEASMAYSGFERFDGEVAGRKGSFLLRHSAVMAAGGGSFEVVVMAESGTGELSGLSGAANIERHDDGTHKFTLDYDLTEPTSPT